MKKKEIALLIALGEKLGLQYSDQFTLDKRQLSEKDIKKTEKFMSTGFGSKVSKLFNGSIGHINSINGKYNEADVKVFIDARPHEGGRTFTYYVIDVLFNSNLKLGLKIYKEGFFSKVGKFFGTQDIQTGWRELDDIVMIKANDKNTVMNLLFDRDGAKEALRDMFLMENESRDDILLVDDFGIRYETQSLILTKHDVVRDHLDIMTRAAKAIMP